MELSESEYKLLKSGLYNANSVMQHLRVRFEQLETTVAKQGHELFRLTECLEELTKADV